MAALGAHFEKYPDIPVYVNGEVVASRTGYPPFSAPVVRSLVLLQIPAHTAGLESGPGLGQHIGLIRMVGLVGMDHSEHTTAQ